jgi:hypothetical protein
VVDRFSREQFTHEEYLMTTLAITPASGSITATRTVCRVECADAPTNTLTGYDGTESYAGQPAQYPASPAEVYYYEFVLGGVQKGKSYLFSPNGGNHVFNNYIFPEAGSWTVNLVRVRDSGTEATLAVTVS